MPKEKLILALDNFKVCPSWNNELDWVKHMVYSLCEYVGYFKVGLELIVGAGALQVIKTIHQAGGRVFLDGKFHDIPNTVGLAARRASDMGVAMFNVHASAGPGAIKAAVANKGNAKVLAVTVLTSLDESDTVQIYGRPTRIVVPGLAQEAIYRGVDGIICSPKELDIMKSNFPDAMLVTPGVRPVWAAANDQKRVMTPGDAIKAGATHIVVGRPITNPPPEIGNPVEAAKRILEEIDNV